MRPEKARWRRQSSRLPSANTWDQLRMRTECRNPVGQNGSAFTSASMTSGLSASTIHSPPAGSPDSARNGPAALIRAALCSRNDKWQPCGGGERRRRASRCLRTGRHKASGFLRAAWTAKAASARLPREGALLQLQPAEMQMLNWNDLRYVLAVSRGGTLAAAARLLGVDDTTVARRLVPMQETIGTRLYQRLADGTLQLTTSG